MSADFVVTQVAVHELIARVPDLFVRLGCREDEIGSDTLCTLIEVRKDRSRIVLDWGLGQLADDYQKATPYDQWLRSQTRLGFWELAMSWHLYKMALTAGGEFLEFWPRLLRHEIPTSPDLGFLALSRGHLLWNFQLELLLQLAGLSLRDSHQVRKDWNAKKPTATAVVATHSLSDGQLLAEILESRLLRPARLVFSVPVGQVSAIAAHMGS